MSLQDTSIIIVTYNHIKHIENCLNSLNNNNKRLEIIVVDNNSTDGTPEFIELNFPSIKIIKSHDNKGYGAGVNLGMKSTQRKYIVVLNPDTIVKENAIKELLKPLKNDDKLITTPKVLIYDGSKINTCGNIEHFTGLAFTRGLGEDPDAFTEYEFIKGLSGVCFAMKRENYLDIGGFNEKFFLYMEDVILSWIAHSRGYKILFVPNAVIHHDYTLEVSPKKIYYLEKGRYMIIRKYFTGIDYLSILPSFIMTEILTWGYALLNGITGIKFKVRALKEGLRTDIIKIDSDRTTLLKSLDWKIPEDQLNDNIMAKIFLRIANWVYKVNYRMIT